ncbi:tetratricopeptide repeat protein [Streptomyces sp. NPDC127108]|uniref:tetratricopeptide repeat protein n=1 Tax=Streptomyces sp. NPDC127108 TaxID=3345361 RepID=UPI00362B014A
MVKDLARQATVAEALATAGHQEQALALLHGVEEQLTPLLSEEDEMVLIGNSTDPHLQGSWTYDSLLRALASAGRADRALRLGDALSSVGHRDYWMTDIVLRTAAAGQSRLAEALTHSVTEDFRRDLVRHKLAAVLARRGEHDAALTLARSLADSDRPSVFAEVVTQLAGAGRWAEATALYEEADSSVPSSRHAFGWDSTDVAWARAAHAVGDHRRAAELLAGAENRPHRYLDDTEKHREMARTLAFMGDVDRATAYIRSVSTYRDAQADAATGFIEGLVDRGDHATAETHAQSFPHPATTAKACLTLALSLPPAEAKKAAALAAHHGDWLSSLTALLRAEPACLDILTAPDVWPRLLGARRPYEG